MGVASGAFFGLSAALASRLSAPGAALWVFMALSAGGGVFAISRLKGHVVSLSGPDFPCRSMAILTLMSLLTSVSYYAALQLGPVGPVAALHLCAPILLLLWGLLRGQRRWEARDLIVLLLLSAGMAIFGLVGQSGTGKSVSTIQLWASLGLSLLSGVALAVSFHYLHDLSRQPGAQALNGLRILAAGVLFLPVSLWIGVSLEQAALATILGLVHIPAIMLQTASFSRLTAVQASSLSLIEAPAAAMAAGMLFGQSLSLVVMIGMGAVLGAVLLEIARRASPQGESAS